MTESSELIVDRPEEGVLRLTLNRPEKRNAISNALRAELIAALQAADGDVDANDDYGDNNYDPLFQFGFGLSYNK